MLSFNPMNYQDFYGRDKSEIKSADHFGQKQTATLNNPQQQHSVDVQYSLSIAYERLQGQVSGRMQPDAVSKSSQVSPSNSDFTPQSVADRIMGFIGDRLQQERDNGASEGRLQQLYQQALKGVEQGLREAKGVLQSQDLLQGENKQNFYDTVNLVANGLEQLGESLFDKEMAMDSIDKGSQTSLSRQRSFEMEVITQDGDRVTLQVQAGQQLSAGSDMQFTHFENLSFSVEGELDEEERAALTDLLKQVNIVAGEFYEGDVELAFDQALTVGMNTDQLAAFAVNMHKAHTVTANQAYTSVDNMVGPTVQNPMADIMERLAGFADSLRHARDQIESAQQSVFNGRDFLDQAVAELYPQTPGGLANSKPFEEFVGALA